MDKESCVPLSAFLQRGGEPAFPLRMVDEVGDGARIDLT
jgi:hypothetical protein